ncbi:MAG TPA: hypothetical protein VMV83_06920 [Rectinemataceae bacterium]|nr:hypothetical protein [Rectinemataceae bacterium]
MSFDERSLLTGELRTFAVGGFAFDELNQFAKHVNSLENDVEARGRRLYASLYKNLKKGLGFVSEGFDLLEIEITRTPFYRMKEAKDGVETTAIGGYIPLFLPQGGIQFFKFRLSVIETLVPFRDEGLDDFSGFFVHRFGHCIVQ